MNKYWNLRDDDCAKHFVFDESIFYCYDAHEKKNRLKNVITEKDNFPS